MLTFDKLVTDDRTFCKRALVSPDQHLSDPFEGEPYACVLWDHGAAYSDAQRGTLVSEVIGSGCRYAVCAGVDCETWHEAFDRGIVMAELDAEGQSMPMVMTTSHVGEPPGEVAWYLANCTDFGEHSFTRFLVIHVGAAAGVDPLDLAVAAELSHRAMRAAP